MLTLPCLSPASFLAARPSGRQRLGFKHPGSELTYLESRFPDHSLLSFFSISPSHSLCSSLTPLYPAKWSRGEELEWTGFEVSSLWGQVKLERVPRGARSSQPGGDRSRTTYGRRSRLFRALGVGSHRLCSQSTWTHSHRCQNPERERQIRILLPPGPERERCAINSQFWLSALRTPSRIPQSLVFS